MLSYRPRFVIRNESSLHARLYTAPDTQRLKAKPRGHPNTDQSLFPKPTVACSTRRPGPSFSLFQQRLFQQYLLQRHLLRHYLLMSYYPRFGRECLAKRASKLYFIDGERTDGR